MQAYTIWGRAAMETKPPSALSALLFPSLDAPQRVFTKKGTLPCVKVWKQTENLRHYQEI